MKDLMGMMGKLKDMQSKMQNMQAEIAELEAEGVAGGGMVKVVLGVLKVMLLGLFVFFEEGARCTLSLAAAVASVGSPIRGAKGAGAAGAKLFKLLGLVTLSQTLDKAAGKGLKSRQLHELTNLRFI